MLGLMFLAWRYEYVDYSGEEEEEAEAEAATKEEKIRRTSRARRASVISQTRG